MTPQPVAAGCAPELAVAKVKWACWLGVLALACGNTGTPTPQAGRPVTGDGMYLTDHALPRPYRHLFAFEVTGPYYLAFSGPYACVLTSEQYTLLRRGEWLTCDWRAPRP